MIPIIKIEEKILLIKIIIMMSLTYIIVQMIILNIRTKTEIEEVNLIEVEIGIEIEIKIMDIDRVQRVLISQNLKMTIGWNIEMIFMSIKEGIILI